MHLAGDEKGEGQEPAANGEVKVPLRLFDTPRVDLLLKLSLSYLAPEAIKAWVWATSPQWAK